MPTTPNSLLRYPGMSDAPNGPVGLQNLALDVDAVLAGAAWSALTLNLGGVAGNFTATAGYSLQVRKIANRVHVRGMVTWSTGLLTSVMTTVPVGSRPTTATWMQVSLGSGTTCVTQVLCSANGTISIPGVAYYTGTPSAPMRIAINGSWLVD